MVVNNFLGISASLEPLLLEERAKNMTDPDTLSLKITELKEGQRVAWRRIVDPAVTPFERREIRNHLKESDGELRRCLAMMSDRLRFQSPQVEDVGDSFENLKFRLLA